ncbi:MAG: 30S ribosomal protein S16 [Candidatus Moranbacteria bacterium GW2011_GWC2_37_73]|nr:MAG: 30S ribosomal protein S16 [Parcubacteria group bacterium GW2011_GWC1_36_108]KKQ39641.1 MAG: 30S ribosomal protein S16 [Candidatus Moranbacteria bacterium GW2011_GWC2_37_73]HAR99928.1 30S ribosomal protein S16 [Candidatus Moranbacteria bacterium]HBI51097.1 30S ribosomal protein S16 [Candidatus Moranbacteria bacterium]HBU10465.1 30S ribosomal protein S16 [Candidatus Moranbacteria bacterium]
MLTIRFSRVGRKNKAQFRVVLQQHTAAPTGRHVAVLGSYDPHQKVAVLKADKIKEWIAKGAQVSDSAYNLFVKEGVIEGKKRAVKMVKAVVPEASAEVETKPAEEVKVEEKKAEEVKTEEAAPVVEETKAE